MRIDEIQTLKRRLPPIKVSGGLFNPKQFKSPAYSVYTASGFVAYLGLYTGLFPHFLVSTTDLTTPIPSADLHRHKRTITGRPRQPLHLPCLDR
jgi:hypothetical protein